MSKRLLVRGVLGLAALLAAGGTAWLLTLPPASVAGSPQPITQEEHDATVNALSSPKRQRPLIAVVGVNDGTETTDYLLPYGILQRADVADVVALSLLPGPVKLYPALRVMPHATVAEFNARHPNGADYVIVPAMRRDDDPAVLNWLRQQADKGALIIGVCAGAKVLANAGLLDGKRATTHWYFVDDLRRAHPDVRYVADRRFVVDKGVATTTGITASMPMALTLIEAIAGRDRAQAVAAEVGLADWDARHNSEAFRFTRSFAMTAIANRLAFWKFERLGIELTPGIDEMALALVADAWSRTYRSRAISYAENGAAVMTRSGLAVLPDETVTGWPAERRLPPVGPLRPAAALDRALHDIAARYGPRTADFVATQLEYAGPEEGW